MKYRDAIIVPAIALAMLAGMEIALRLIFAEPERERPLRDVNAIAFETHPDYLVMVKPNLQRRPFVRRAAAGDVVTHWNTNSASFRGAEIGPKAGWRVIVYGDSNIFARFSDDEHTFAQQLQSRLRQRVAGPVEVLNAGVPGFGPDQSLLRFRDEVRQYHPDLVVFHLFADNDFGDLLRNRLFSPADDGGLVRRPAPAEPDPCLSGGQCAELPVGIAARLRELASSLMVTRATGKALAMAGVELRRAGPTADEEIRYYLSASELEYEAYLDPARATFSSFADHYDFDLALRPDAGSSRLKLRLMRAVLAAARDTATRNGVGLLLLVQPSSRDLTENLTPNFTHFRRFPGYRPSNLSSAAADIGHSLHMDVVNLYAIYRDSHPERLYFRDGDNHWTDEGQALAADVVAQHLAQQGRVFPAAEAASKRASAAGEASHRVERP